MKSFDELSRVKKDSEEQYLLYKCALLGDSATQFLGKALKGQAYLEKIELDLYESDYNQIELQIVDKESDLYKFNPQMVVISMCTEKLYEKYFELPSDMRVRFAEEIAEQVYTYWKIIEQAIHVNIIQFCFIEKNDGVFGNYALKIDSSFLYQIKKLNLLLMETAHQYKNVFLVDINSIVMKQGTTFVQDYRLYFSAKIAYSLNALPYIATQIIDIIKAIQGIRIKKCVICDLDNTLWGGIISEDGLNGIEIGEYGQGGAYVFFQKWLKELKKRGILLAVCSKNDDEQAKEAFDKHPDMVLKLDDFALFVANWKSKAENILYIQETLNIGLDSIVFLDDSPFERNLVRDSLGGLITVPELPDDPSLYVDFLSSLNLFETSSYSEEDVERTQRYQAEAGRKKVLETYKSYDDYLKDLNMIAEMHCFDEFHFARISQLTQRSNQFNLRTVRYTEKEIADIAHDEDYLPFYFTLKDKFGDYGLIGVVILRKIAPDGLFIEGWLMSCRVLKRGMEDYMMNAIITLASERKIKYIYGEYIKTAKNAMVKDLYRKYGFDKMEEDGKYVIDIDKYSYRNLYIHDALEGSNRNGENIL